MNIFNKKGSALMQVMVLGSIIAAIIVMLMRFSLGRTSNMLKTKRVVASKAYAEGCIAQYNAIAVERAMAGVPPVIDGNNQERFTCIIDGKSTDIYIKWGSTATGLGNINFYIDTTQFQ